MSGRLEIYLPDTPVESFILQKEVIAIGRSPGNDLVFDRNGISRYHAKLTFEDQQMMLTDLEAVNGVYVDGMRIKATEPRVLRGGEEIQLADVRLIYYPPESLQEDTHPTELADTTQHFATDKLAVHISGPDSPVVPGSHVQALLVIDNLTDESNRYLINVEGIPSEWVRLERSEVEIAGKDQIRIMASFKPLRRSETHPGNYPLKFNVCPKNDRESFSSVESTLVVGVFSGYGVMMGTTVVEGKQPFRMHVHNQGNEQLRLSFRGIDPQNNLNIDINPLHVALAAGERRSINGSIRPKNGNLFGSPHKYSYDIISRSHDASGFQAPVSGVYVSKPLLPSWAATVTVPLIAVVVIGLIALVVALLAGKEEPVVPVIASFTAAQEEIVLGNPVTLDWIVTNANTISIEYARPNQPPQEIPVENPQAGTSYQLMLETSGIYTVILHVENTGGR